MKQRVGAQFHAIDLHVHTPASYDYKDKSATPDDIIKSALDASLSAIAITDHNTIAWVDQVRSAAKDKPLKVFPGVEITTHNGHLLAIFDPETSSDVVEGVLIRSGINKADFGKTEAIGESIFKVMKIVTEAGGLCIAAHIDSPKGFMTANSQGQTRVKIYNDANLSAIELVSDENRDSYTKGQLAGYNRSLPCVQGSDAHSLSQIGSRLTYLKMQHLNLKGLCQAFAEPLLRVKLKDGWESIGYPHVVSLEANKGFLAGQPILFNEGLNCLVGGAGSGKSTVIEFLRFTLDQISQIDDIAEDCVGKLDELATIGAQITVVVETGPEEQYRIVREYDGYNNPITVTRLSDKTPLEHIDVKQFFPVHAYSQGEAISISRSPLAQLSLIDKHIDLSGYQNEISKAYQELEGQEVQLIQLDTQLAEKDNLEREKKTNDAKIAELTKRYNQLTKAQKDPILTTHPLWVSEKDYLSEVIKNLEAASEVTENTIQNIEFEPANVPFPEGRVPNETLLRECQRIVVRFDDARKAAITTLSEAIQQIDQEVREKAQVWKEAYSKHNNEYKRVSNLLDANEIERIGNLIGNLNKKQQKLRTELGEVERAETKRIRLIERRNILLEKIQDQKNRITALRQRKAKELVKKIGGSVSLKVIPSGNRQEFEDVLVDLMRGSRAPRKVTQKLCVAFTPIELAELVRQRDINKIDEYAEIGTRWAQVFVDKTSSEIGFIYSLEAVSTEDSVDIGFRNDSGDYRPLRKLSTGQKATVIVLLTMIEGKQPIIFDQPEDALYTPFIYTEVVKMLRQEKDKRQYIFATHNANISIAADLDLGIVLESSSDSSEVRAYGGLDDGDTQKLMVLHLEGGPEALMKRLNKLGIK